MSINCNVHGHELAQHPAENKPQLLVGLGIAVVSLSAAYWLVKRANAAPARVSLGPDRSSRDDAFDGDVDTDGLRH